MPEADAGIELDGLRLRAFLFPQSVRDFIDSHGYVFAPSKLVKVLHFDGTPITARFITQAITRQVHSLATTPR